MGKRRELLIWLLLIVVVIGCLTHTSCGQENDTVNVSHPSLAKSVFSHEDILNHAQKSLDMSISILNTVATLMGVLVALLTAIVVIGGALGFLEYRRWQEFKQQAKASADAAKGYADEAKKAAEEAKPIIDGIKKAEEEINSFRERIMQFPSLLEAPSEELKKILDEYGSKIEFLEAFFELPLKSVDYIYRGFGLYYKEKYELALKAFDKAIELKPDDTVAWNYRGMTLGKLDRHDEALKAFDKAIELKPEDAAAWYNKGVTLDKLDHYEEALKAYDKAIELKADYASAWYNKACVYSLKGEKENALKHLSKAIALDAKHKEEAKSDDDFKNLWDDGDFKTIVS